MPPGARRRKKAPTNGVAAKKPARNGRAVYDGEGNVVDNAPRLIKGDDSELRRQMVAKRKEIRLAKTDYSKAGSRVKTLQDDLEKLLEEADRRSDLEGKRQPALV